MTWTPDVSTNGTSHRVGAIIVAAGSSARMGGVDKIFHPILGLPLVGYSLRVLQDSPEVDDIVLVVAPRSIEAAQRLVDDLGCTKVVAVCPGGDRRQDSVGNGLDQLPGVEWVLVQDGARPCITQDMVRRSLETASITGAAVAAVPVKDTIKVVDDDGGVVHTVPRDSLRAIQSPQTFTADILRRAHKEVDSSVTDDATLVELLGYQVRSYPGSYANIKVTTPEDIALVETLLTGLRQEVKS